MKFKYDKKDIKAFILIRKYPGCNKPIGYIEPNTTGEFIKYPEIWEPIFTKRFIRDNKIKSLGI